MARVALLVQPIHPEYEGCAPAMPAEGGHITARSSVSSSSYYNKPLIQPGSLPVISVVIIEQPGCIGELFLFSSVLEAV